MTTIYGVIGYLVLYFALVFMSVYKYRLEEDPKIDL